MTTPYRVFIFTPKLGEWCNKKCAYLRQIHRDNVVVTIVVTSQPLPQTINNDVSSADEVFVVNDLSVFIKVALDPQKTHLVFDESGDVIVTYNQLLLECAGSFLLSNLVDVLKSVRCTSENDKQSLLQFYEGYILDGRITID